VAPATWAKSPLPVSCALPRRLTGEVALTCAFARAPPAVFSRSPGRASVASLGPAADHRCTLSCAHRPRSPSPFQGRRLSFSASSGLVDDHHQPAGRVSGGCLPPGQLLPGPCQRTGLRVVDGAARWAHVPNRQNRDVGRRSRRSRSARPVSETRLRGCFDRLDSCRCPSSRRRRYVAGRKRRSICRCPSPRPTPSRACRAGHVQPGQRLLTETEATSPGFRLAALRRALPGICRPGRALGERHRRASLQRVGEAHAEGEVPRAASFSPHGAICCPR